MAALARLREAAAVVDDAGVSMPPAVMKAALAAVVAPTLEDAARAAAALAVALKSVAAEAAAHDERVRAALRDVLAETGMPKFRTPDGRPVSLCEPRRRVVITDAAALAAARPDLTETITAPVRERVQDAMERGEAVAGAEWSNGGPPTLRIGNVKENRK